MKRLLAALGFAVVALGMFALTDTASATNGVLDDFTAAYPSTAGTSLDSCSTCHTSVPALNAYGSAVKASGMNFSGIEGLDSDGDGVGNLQEIKNLTNPGNAADRPATTTTTTSTTSTTSTTAAASPQSVAATPAPAPNVTVAPTGATAFDAGPAGKVWLSVGSGVLIVERVDTSWNFEIEMDDDGEVEVKFRNGGQEIEFEAELEDGTIKTTLEIESDDHHDDDDRDSDDDDHGDEDDDHGGRDHDDDHESDDDDD